MTILKGASFLYPVVNPPYPLYDRFGAVEDNDLALAQRAYWIDGNDEAIEIREVLMPLTTTTM